MYVVGVAAFGAVRAAVLEKCCREVLFIVAGFRAQQAGFRDAPGCTLLLQSVVEEPCAKCGQQGWSPACITAAGRMVSNEMVFLCGETPLENCQLLWARVCSENNQRCPVDICRALEVASKKAIRHQNGHLENFAPAAARPLGPVAIFHKTCLATSVLFGFTRPGQNGTSWFTRTCTSFPEVPVSA